MKHRAVRAEYDRLAAEYERRWGHYVDATNRHTLRFLTLEPGARVLDLGCGTGPLLAAIGVAFPEVRTTGLDLSREMLRTAQTRMGEHRALVQGDVTDLPFAHGRFDCVVSASSFHFWRSPATALAEIARVLKPGGQLVITDWCDDYLACKICDRVLRVVSRAHHRIYGSGEFAELLDANGYRVTTLEHYKINWLWGLMTASATTPGPPP